MKSVHFKNSNNEKTTTPRKIKPVKPEKTLIIKTTSNLKVPNPSESEWLPSRDWHKYLSDQQSEEPKKPFACKDFVTKDENDAKNREEIMLKKPSDELLSIKLPTVNFCSGDKTLNPRSLNMPSIADLCDGDKSRIVQLVQELAKCKQDKQEDEQTISMLKNKVSDLKTSMRKLLTDKTYDSQTISKIQSQHDSEQLALKNQLSELNRLLYQMQVQKTTTEVQLKTIVAQAEKMTRVIHEMHRENTELQVELRVTKERLNVAQNAVEKITKDLKEVHYHMKPLMEDKACQSNEDFGTGDVKVENKTPSQDLPDDQRILCELFFNKAVQNDFTPKETVIILPTDSTSLYKTF